MTDETSEKLCKFQKSGFCKFQTKCHLKNVQDICNDKKCEETGCLRRHPRRCRYFYLRSFCKFKENCKYSHVEEKICEERELIRESKSLEKKTKELETEVTQLKLANQKLKDILKKVNDELEKVKKERDVLHVKNKEITEVNERLIEDIAILNERISYIIPGVLEEEN